MWIFRAPKDSENDTSHSSWMVQHGIAVLVRIIGTSRGPRLSNLRFQCAWLGEWNQNYKKNGIFKTRNSPGTCRFQFTMQWAACAFALQMERAEFTLSSDAFRTCLSCVICCSGIKSARMHLLFDDYSRSSSIILESTNRAHGVVHAITQCMLQLQYVVWSK